MSGPASSRGSTSRSTPASVNPTWAIASVRLRAYKKCVGKVSAAFAVVATALLLTSAASAATRGGASAGSWYTVAFTSSSLPANVDKLVSDAGGTIVVRLPQIGGIGVVSANPSFAAQMSASASVAAAQPSSRTSVDPSSDASAFGAPFARHSPSSAGTDPQAEPDD